MRSTSETLLTEKCFGGETPKKCEHLQDILPKKKKKKKKIYKTYIVNVFLRVPSLFRVSPWKHFFFC